MSNGAAGGPVVFRAAAQNFSPAVQELDAAMRSGRLRHPGDAVREWRLGHVAGRADRRGNLYPTKPRPERRIGAAVALPIALGRATAGAEDVAGLAAFLADLVML